MAEDYSGQADGSMWATGQGAARGPRGRRPELAGAVGRRPDASRVRPAEVMPLSSGVTMLRS